jgi:hypothetical protein
MYLRWRKKTNIEKQTEKVERSIDVEKRAGKFMKAAYPILHAFFKSSKKSYYRAKYRRW